VNLELLRELDDRRRRIQNVLDGQESGNADILFQKLLDRVAAAGRESPEYGLALRA
jgi:hypothetical protein